MADVLLQRGFPDACIADAVLLTSEVVTHAVSLGGSEIAVEVAADHRMGRVDVHLMDARSSNGSAKLDPPSGARRLLLEAVSEAWGLQLDGARPCLWFEVRS